MLVVDLFSLIFADRTAGTSQTLVTGIADSKCFFVQTCADDKLLPAILGYLGCQKSYNAKNYVKPMGEGERLSQCCRVLICR